jgi:hypothetical protein
VKDVFGGQINDAGLVNVMYGSSTGLTTTGDQVWHQGVSGVPGMLEDGDFCGTAVY